MIIKRNGISVEITNTESGTKIDIGKFGGFDIEGIHAKVIFPVDSTDVGLEVEDDIPKQSAPTLLSYGKATNMRIVRTLHISPNILWNAINKGTLNEILHPFDEIDIPINTGGIVTAVCGYVEPIWARFVLKDCWDVGAMNEENTYKTDYFRSLGREHVKNDILPQIAPEWRAIFIPRKMVEIIDGMRVEYEDLMWLPSTTDVTGLTEDGIVEDIGKNLQLPIFKRMRDRVKEYEDNVTFPYWLRSVHEGTVHSFYCVGSNGSYGYNEAHHTRGFALGFDIGRMETKDE